MYWHAAKHIHECVSLVLFILILLQFRFPPNFYALLLISSQTAGINLWNTVVLKILAKKGQGMGNYILLID